MRLNDIFPEQRRDPQSAQEDAVTELRSCESLLQEFNEKMAQHRLLSCIPVSPLPPQIDEHGGASE